MCLWCVSPLGHAVISHEIPDRPNPQGSVFFVLRDERGYAR